MAAIAPLLAMFVILFLIFKLAKWSAYQKEVSSCSSVSGERLRLRQVYGSWQGASQERVLRMRRVKSGPQSFCSPDLFAAIWFHEIDLVRPCRSTY